MIALTSWEQKLCTAISLRCVDKVASALAFEYESLSWWEWLRRLRIRRRLRMVTVALDAYRYGRQDGAAEKGK